MHYPMLDYIRLLLAIEVVLLHFHYIKPQYWLVFAVPGFLAISGFVVLQSLETSHNLYHFWWKRILRLMPAFLFMLIVTFFVIGGKYVLDTGYVLRTFGLYGFKGNGPCWSLSCEIIAYICMVVFYLFGGYKNPWLLFLFLGIWMIPVLFPPKTPLFFGIKRYLIWNHSLLVVSFLLGNLVYLYRERAILFAKKMGFFLLPFLLTHAITWNMNCSLGLKGLGDIISVLACLLIGISFNPKFKLNFDLSYSTYIWHQPMRVYFAEINDYGKLAALIAVFFVTLISWFVVEKPALRLKNMRIARP